MSNAQHPQRRSYHPLLRPFSRLLLALTTRYQAVGQEHMPDPPFIIVSNHLSYFDAFAATAASKVDVVALTAKKLQDSFIGWLLNHTMMPLYIEQETADRQALKRALQFVKEGFAVGIAPEGHRSRTGELMRGFPGSAYLIRKANVPVVPMALMGTERIFRVPRPRVEAHIGKAYYLPEITGRADASNLQDDTDHLMCTIAAMLPPAYHGVYAGHPLLEEMKTIVY